LFFVSFFFCGPSLQKKKSSHRKGPDAKPLRQELLLRRVDRGDADRDPGVWVVVERREVVVEVEAVNSCSSSPAVVAKLVPPRAVGDGLALLPDGLAAGLVGEALRQGPPGGLELAAVRAPGRLFGKGFFF